MKIKMIEVKIEYTDTFGGEANYSWVRRHTTKVRANITNRGLMRMAKAWAGITGAKGKMIDGGDELFFYPYRLNTALFITCNPIE